MASILLTGRESSPGTRQQELRRYSQDRAVADRAALQAAELSAGDPADQAAVRSILDGLGSTSGLPAARWSSTSRRTTQPATGRCDRRVPPGHRPDDAGTAFRRVQPHPRGRRHGPRGVFGETLRGVRRAGSGWHSRLGRDRGSGGLAVLRRGTLPAAAELRAGGRDARADRAHRIGGPPAVRRGCAPASRQDQRVRFDPDDVPGPGDQQQPARRRAPLPARPGTGRYVQAGLPGQVADRPLCCVGESRRVLHRRSAHP